MIAYRLTPEEAKFVQDCLAARLGSIHEVLDDAESAVEKAAFFAQLDLAAELGHRLLTLRAIDAKERYSAQ